jgi:hypothetical protein
MKVIIRVAVKDNTWEEAHQQVSHISIQEDWVTVYLKDKSEIRYSTRYIVSIKEYKNE